MSRQHIDPASYKQCIAALEVFPGRVRFKHMRIALSAGGGVLKNIAERLAPRQSSALAAAQAVKVRIPDASYNSKHHGKPAYAVIGTKRKFIKLAANIGGTTKLVTVRRIAKVNFDKTVLIRRPSRYAHLAGPGRKQAFMTQAARQGGLHAQRRVIAKLQSGALQEAHKLAREAGV